MSNNPAESSSSDDFLHHLLRLANPSFPPPDTALTAPVVQPPPQMLLHLGSSANNIANLAAPRAAAEFHGTMFPLGLSLEQGNGGLLKPDDVSSAGKRFRGEVFDVRPPQPQVFHGQPVTNTMHAAPQTPTARPRVRARRGQATDPHSIAERLRRERIAERIRALQELVPSVNKTDRAVMLDEIVDYVKFLRLQVKVLSMSRLGGAGAVAPNVTDIPLPSLEEEGSEGTNKPAWEIWSNDSTEQQVAKLMEENVGAAMQFLQSKALCIMPLSLASAMYHDQPPDSSSIVRHGASPP